MKSGELYKVCKEIRTARNKLLMTYHSKNNNFVRLNENSILLILDVYTLHPTSEVKLVTFLHDNRSLQCWSVDIEKNCTILEEK